MLAILTSHPIQYQVPLWRALAESSRVPFQVWYLTNHGVHESRDDEFGRSFAWDVDLMSGYPHAFLDVEPNWDVLRFRGVRLRESLADRLKREGVRALWIEGWRLQANWQAVRAARAANVPVWLRGESNDLKRDAGWKSIWKRPLMRRYFDSVADFLCIGSANRRLYESYGVPATQLHRAPYCVDNDRFRAEAEKLRPERAAIREKWGVPPDAFCVLFCGKFTSKKRPFDLVEAARRVNARPRGAAIHLLMVGSGELGGELRNACSVQFDPEAAACDSASVDGKPPASFVGFLNQSEVARAHVAADVLVLPSDSGETWGLVANEAMACGTPAIVSDLCGCAENLVAPLEPGFVFRCGDVDALARAIEKARDLNSQPELLQRVADTHHLRHTVATVQELYGQLPG